MDVSSLGSSVHGILQARILEWVAVSFSSGSSWSRDQTCSFCIGRWILYRWAAWEAPSLVLGVVTREFLPPSHTSSLLSFFLSFFLLSALLFFLFPFISLFDRSASLPEDLKMKTFIQNYCSENSHYWILAPLKRWAWISSKVTVNSLTHIILKWSLFC